MPRLATGCEGDAVILDYWLGGAIAVVLTVYLLYALLRAERF